LVSVSERSTPFSTSGPSAELPAPFSRGRFGAMTKQAK